MAQVSLTIAGRAYQVACEDGHEDQVAELGKELDRRAQALSRAAGAISEGVLLTLVGVMVADELAETKRAAQQAQDRLVEVERRDVGRAAAGQPQDNEARRWQDAVALANAQAEIQSLSQTLEGMRGENAILTTRLKDADGQEQALRSRAADLESRLAEMKATLEAARIRLEQQRAVSGQQDRIQDAAAALIDSLAERVETVAERLTET